MMKQKKIVNTPATNDETCQPSAFEIQYTDFITY